MRICILTQPLKTNYGGLLQAYALQTILRRMGHEVWTEDRKDNRRTLWQDIKYKIKILLGPIRHVYFPTAKDIRVISQRTDNFIRKYINTTEAIYTQEKPEFDKYGFDAYIVGSDQVWRPYYSPGIKNYFLDFTARKDVKRIAYAASFGTDEWEYTPELTESCAQLLKEFDAVSVREDSGVDMCKKYFGVGAEHLLDPTMLLCRDDYQRIVWNEKEPSHSAKIMTYILDVTPEKTRIVDHVASRLGMSIFSVMPKNSFSQVGKRYINDCIYPSVTEWLKGFDDADFVITDSFHGTVFSIIYNKPFIAISNKNRGNSRFTSLLRKFNLMDRIISSYDSGSIDRIVSAPIDYSAVDNIIQAEKQKSYTFLGKAIR